MYSIFWVFFLIVIVMKITNRGKNKGTKPNVPRKRSTDETDYAFKDNPQRKAVTQVTTQVTTQPAPRPSVQSVKSEQMSTTELLDAKAKADEREHQREKQLRQIENKKHYGHHNYAMKYEIGSSIPKGKRMVYCSYCNAENLVPQHDNASKYNCYFCREKL